jgi:serine phosphatase RsbU (regulator of sigma subunit)
VVTRVVPAHGDVGGDVVLCLPDTRGGWWLLAADVVGSGPVAALLARSVRAAARTAAPWAPGPAALLEALEHGIADDVPAGCFVTAIAVHLSEDGTVRAASAGHPPPLVVGGGAAEELPVDPGPPLALETTRSGARPEHEATLPRGAALLLHTDGLTERRCHDGVRLLDPVRLVAQLPDDLDAAADALLAAADAVGPAEDDVSVLLARPPA